MKTYSKFQIWVKLPSGLKQLIWEQTLEGDTVFNEKMEEYKNSYEFAGHKIIYAKRSMFGSKALFANNPEKFVNKIYVFEKFSQGGTYESSNC